MESKKVFIGTIIIVIIVCLGIIIDNETKITMPDEDKFKDMDITYPVRDVFRGYEDGKSIIIVDYYDENSIKTVSNQYLFGGRVNSIIKRRSSNNDSYLHWYATNSKKTYAYTGAYPKYPRNKYILYLADDLECTGIKTHTPHSDQPDYNSFIE